ncbi:MAG TPA: Hpt domain-containing protein, partial [Gemmata sp.]|nr:Hpt domain-containing protein [Gemmata sp.]
MSSREDNDSAALFPEYVAECEEHLTSAGQILLALETAPDRLNRNQLDGLFRNFHTVKGLSGMVGLHEAERLAHDLENYLGVIRKGLALLSVEGMAILIEGVRSLERLITARAEGVPIPDVSPLIVRLTSLLPDQSPVSPAFSTTVLEPGPNPSDLPPDPFARADAAVRNGDQVWRVKFEPSPALTERGLTVNVVRERLREAGEIVHAAPIVAPGRVTFTFLILSRMADFEAAFQDNGLTVERYEPAPHRKAEVAPPGPIHRANSMTPTNLVRVDLSRLDELMRT